MSLYVIATVGVTSRVWYRYHYPLIVVLDIYFICVIIYNL
jgi:hypothetical protein